MTAQAPELAAVVARLERVERQNRRLRGRELRSWYWPPLGY